MSTDKRSDQLAAMGARQRAAIEAMTDQLDQIHLDLGRAVLAEGLSDDEMASTSYVYGLIAGREGEAIQWDEDRLYYAGYAKGWDENNGEDEFDDGPPRLPELVGA